MITSQFEIIMIINATITQIAVTFFAFFCKFTIDNTSPLAIIFFHQNKRPSPIKGPLLKIRLQDPLNVLHENSSPVHYWCAYGKWFQAITAKWLVCCKPLWTTLAYKLITFLVCPLRGTVKSPIEARLLLFFYMAWGG